MKHPFLLVAALLASCALFSTPGMAAPKAPSCSDRALLLEEQISLPLPDRGIERNRLLAQKLRGIADMSQAYAKACPSARHQRLYRFAWFPEDNELTPYCNGIQVAFRSIHDEILAAAATLPDDMKHVALDALAAVKKASGCP